MAHLERILCAAPDWEAGTVERRETVFLHDGRAGAADSTFTFPFETIEDVVRLDDSHILVINDNNLPFSTGREPNRAADNEFILLEVRELLDFRMPPA